MTIDTLAPWLRCPVCAEPLERVERLTLGCASGHRFDVNKRGFVNLVAGGTGLIGDSAEMLDARETILESGLYSPISNALAALGAGTRVLDAGVGTGYYLRAVLAAHPDARGLAMDLSPTAVARAVRASPGIDGLVADTWRPLPIRDGVCDVILDVFAPRNLPEFHRILKPAGSLLVVVPLHDHLAELRAGGRMLEVPADKAAAIVASAAPKFTLREHRAIRATIPLTDATGAALIAMGPSAHHPGPGPEADAPGSPAPVRQAVPSTATLAVDVLHLVRI
ncbi:putative RNA methyltransferase [Leifsonia sp. NPDC058230]|uniref:putative RNA methyltransferase n=1 Tax=Leifsonia sp. NPDC058230 TaxID=3346391 RepID=UPI0036DAB638